MLSDDPASDPDIEAWVAAHRPRAARRSPGTERSSASWSGRRGRSPAGVAAPPRLSRLRRLRAGRPAGPRGHAPVPGGGDRQSRRPPLAGRGGPRVARRGARQGGAPLRRRASRASSSPPAPPRPTTSRSRVSPRAPSGRHVVTLGHRAHLGDQRLPRPREAGRPVTYLPVDGEGRVDPDDGGRARSPGHRARLDRGRQRRDRHAAAGARDRPRSRARGRAVARGRRSARSGACP